MDKQNPGNNNINSYSNAAISQRSIVEDITNQFDQMNVDMVDVMDFQDQHQEENTMSQQSFDEDREDYYNTCNALMEQDESLAMKQLKNSQTDQQQQNMSNILIVTNVDSSVFGGNKQMQSKFESLFLAFDSNVTFRYLKSFRRVRLDFTSPERAEQARCNLSNYLLGKSEFKCYTAQIIRPNYGGNNEDQDYNTNSMYLNIPKLTKQFLISPPASPPLDWKPIEESSPCIDVQLISAIANLVPGKVHEIHPGNESQPGIYVEVCEEPQFEHATRRTCSRIPRTMAPACQTNAPLIGGNH